MEKHEADKLIETIKSFIEDAPPDDYLAPGKASRKEKPTVEEVKAAATGRGPDVLRVAGQAFDEEAMYQRFRARIIDDAQIDPVLLKLLAVQPELIVEYERRTETLDGSSVRGRIAKLIAQGFLDEKRTTGQVRTELARTGADVNSGGLSTALGALLAVGFLVRAGDGWQRAPGITVRERDIEARG